MTAATQPNAQPATLPWQLQLDNAAMAPAILLTPLWWLSMLWSDARDRRRRKWRVPTAPAMLDFFVPPGVAPAEISHYLHGLGIQAALVNLQWEIAHGQIALHKTILVPGRHRAWAQTAIDRFLSGDPIPQRGPAIRANNIEMKMVEIFNAITGNHAAYNGRRIRRK